ncbi:hypothetical protein GGF32_003271 [Allomyces javanicus]|nr:hypothetical protein GGF32_003271 [Allomyces javanicus]
MSATAQGRRVRGPAAPVEAVVVGAQASGKLTVIPSTASSAPTTASAADRSRTSLRDRAVDARDAVLATFLPANYPHSVAPEYLRYTRWTFVHAVTGTVTGVLSMQSLLYAIGLGAGSIPVAAALNWIIKDGLGQLGGVLYASIMGEKFDSEPKRLRFNAALAMQGACLVDLLTPLVPHLFLPLASLSNIGKNIAWLASSATRAQIHQTLAMHDNLGDITGKAGSQTTAAGVVGTGLGVVVSAMVGHDVPSLLAAFLPLSGLSLWALHQSNRVVVTRTLNAQRLDLVLADFAATRSVPTPETIAPRERFLGAYRSSVRVNPPLAAAADAMWVRGGKVLAAPGKVWVAAGAEDEDVLRGYYLASAARDAEGVEKFVAMMAEAGWHAHCVHVDQDRNAVQVVVDEDANGKDVAATR